MFTYIHEFAVLGTAFFMLALATIWYSSILFGNAWMQEARISQEMVDASEKDLWKHLFITYVSYVVMLGLLSLVVVFAPIVSLTPLQASVLIALFFAAAMLPVTLFEGKSLRYYAIHVGFSVLFIILGTSILEYWPW